MSSETIWVLEKIRREKSKTANIYDSFKIGYEIIFFSLGAYYFYFLAYCVCLCSQRSDDNLEELILTFQNMRSRLMSLCLEERACLLLSHLRPRTNHLCELLSNNWAGT